MVTIDTIGGIFGKEVSTKMIIFIYYICIN